MVEIKLESKKYNCTIRIQEKVTFIKGDSGVGKTEFTRRLSSESRANKVTVSNGFDIVVLHYDVFRNLCKRASFGDKDLKKYWGDSDNFPYYNSIIIIDDEDFVRSAEFSIFYNCDKYNYYIIINRSKVPNLSYSADEIYNFVKSGKEHYLEKAYDYPQECVPYGEVEYVMTEGKGSDFIFFNEMLHGSAVNPSMILGENSAGKSNLIKCLKEDLFKNSVMYLLVDFCAFGSDIDDLYNVCKSKNIKAYFDKDYLSFEYLLLVSNFINDTDLNFYLERNRLKYLSLEALFTARLTALTSGEAFRYSKSMRDFPVCYFKNCCENRGNKGTCQKRTYFLGKEKIDWMLKETKFEDLLRLRR